MPVALPEFIRQKLFDAGGGASADTLRQWGLSEGQIRRLARDGALRRVSRGCYALPTATGGPTWASRRSHHLMSLVAQLTPDSVAALRTAALLWNLPISSIPTRPEVIRPPRAGRRKQVRTVCTGLAPDEVTTVNGVLVTTLERTAVDVALDLPVPAALITVDAALRSGASRRLMWDILGRRGAVGGARDARRAIAWGDEYAESALESFGRGQLMVRGVPRPECNMTFAFQGEEFRPDTRWKGLGLIGEADGRGKYDDEETDPQTLWAEKLRQQWFEDELGMGAFRWIDKEMARTPDEAAARWRRIASRPAVRLWVPPPGLEIYRKGQRPPDEG